jgi:hypothetical protein
LNAQIQSENLRKDVLERQISELQKELAFYKEQNAVSVNLLVALKSIVNLSHFIELS